MKIRLTFLAVILAASAAWAAQTETPSKKAKPVPKASFAVGQPAPAFNAKNQDDKDVKLSDYAGKWLVLYFYPRDDTPGWTVEACSFRDNLKELQQANAEVLGVSPDSSESHRKFIKKYDLKFDLLADTDKSVMTAYKAFDKRVQRSTVIISPKGVLAAHFPKVNPRKHIDEVKAKLAELQKK